MKKIKTAIYTFIILLFIVLLVVLFNNIQTKNTLKFSSIVKRNDSLKQLVEEERKKWKIRVDTLLKLDTIYLTIPLKWKEREIKRVQELKKDSATTNNIFDSIVSVHGKPISIHRIEDYPTIKDEYRQLLTFSNKKTKEILIADSLLVSNKNLLEQQQKTAEKLLKKYIREQCKVSFIPFTRTRLWVSKRCMKKFK